MSIFLSIIQRVLIPKIDELCVKSESADYSWFNKLLVTTNLGGRDLEVSARKRHHLNELKNSLQELQDTQPISDADTLQSIKTLIETCYTNLNGARQTERKSYPESSSDQMLWMLPNLIEHIYQKLETLDVLNKQQTDDPLDIFEYYIAYYCATKIVNKRYQSLLEYGLSHPFIANTGLIAAKKEHWIMSYSEIMSDAQSIVGMIPHCRHKVQLLEENRRNNKLERCTLVINFMQKLQNTNLAFYTLNSVDPLVQHSENILERIYDSILNIQRGGGFFGQCLVDATTEIQQQNIFEISEAKDNSYDNLSIA